LAGVNAWAERVAERRLRILSERERIKEWCERLDAGAAEQSAEIDLLPIAIGEAKRSADAIRARRKVLRIELERLRLAVRKNQAALRSLQKSIEKNDRERRLWKGVALEAGATTVQHVLLSTVEGAISMLHTCNAAAIDAIDAAVAKLPQKERRSRAYEMLAQLREENALLEELKAAKLATEQLSTQASDAPKLEKTLDTVADLAAEVLQLPVVQSGLKLSGPYGTVLSASKTILDHGVDVETLWRSHKRIAQYESNSDQFLAAVRRLDSYMVSLVERILAIRAQLGG
jgi:hypothetical protein